MKGIGGHQRAYKGASDDWLTPLEIIEVLQRPLAFDLDPCCPRPMPWCTARKMVERPDDGLAIEWVGRVWLNPPYGPETGKWLARMADHNCGTALIFARTETKMFHEFIWRRGTAALFLEGRLHFCWPDGSRAEHNAGGPSVLVAYGGYDAEILRKSGIKGHFVSLR